METSEYLKIIGMVITDCETEITDETNKSEIGEVADYIMKHQDKNKTWIIKPMFF